MFFETDFSKHTVLWTTVGMRSLSIIYRRLAKLGIKIDDSCASYAVPEGRLRQEQTTRADRAMQHAQTGNLAIAICQEVLDCLVKLVVPSFLFWSMRLGEILIAALFLHRG